MVEIEHPTEPSTALHSTNSEPVNSSRALHQPITQPLVVSLTVVMSYILSERTVKRGAPEEEHTTGTLLFDGTHKPLRICIQIG